MMKRLATLLLLALPALPAAGQSAPGDIDLFPDLTFGEAGGEQLKVDVATPRGKGPFPAILAVHGGGWVAGNRKEMGPLVVELAKNGYVAASVEYRLAPGHKFPAQIEDVKRCVRWLRANAAKYKIDPERIGAVGVSAGAHLVALLGTSSPKDKLEGPGDERQSSRVRAIICWAGPYDFMKGLDSLMRPNTAPLVLALMGGAPQDAQRRAASAVTYVSKDDPPVLLVHGTADEVVSIEHSEIFEKALKEAGVKVDFLRYPGAGHGLAGNDLQQAVTASLKFADVYVKGGPATSKLKP